MHIISSEAQQSYRHSKLNGSSKSILLPAGVDGFLHARRRQLCKRGSAVYPDVHLQCDWAHIPTQQAEPIQRTKVSSVASMLGGCGAILTAYLVSLALAAAQASRAAAACVTSACFTVMPCRRPLSAEIHLLMDSFCCTMSASGFACQFLST